MSTMLTMSVRSEHAGAGKLGLRTSFHICRRIKSRALLSELDRFQRDVFVLLLFSFYENE